MEVGHIGASRIDADCLERQESKLAEARLQAERQSHNEELRKPREDARLAKSGMRWSNECRDADKPYSEPAAHLATVCVVCGAEARGEIGFLALDYALLHVNQQDGREQD